eukprot:Gregarina_sp_Poly_1__2845@NODE_1793_length_3321_cov_76_000000_g1167_i0_p5_GENE_NODE_1793_length_3321_cov_76_000000_g1167_i0NODE_1793_length_3321_cov_76_000000_g1167_i0_p5_ORF_typecomplete_len112_score2_73_NODE_1793_length_3321_cov_76_000000_g1167_i011591494
MQTAQACDFRGFGRRRFPRLARSRAPKLMQLSYHLEAKPTSTRGWTEARVPACIVLEESNDEILVRVEAKATFPRRTHFIIRHLALVAQARGTPKRRFTISSTSNLELVLT